MTLAPNNSARWCAGMLTVALITGGGGYWLGHRSGTTDADSKAQPARKILYWYDPMLPAEHYDNPNSLSSMGMKTTPPAVTAF